MAKANNTWFTRIRRRTVSWFLRDTAVDPRHFESYGVESSSSSEKNDVYLMDFRDWAEGGHNTPTDGIIQVRPRTEVTGNFVVPTDTNSEEENTPPTRVVPIVVRPKDVLAELERKPDPFTLEFLDEKIALIKQKGEMVRAHYVKREVADLLLRLTARKNYAEFAWFFDQFDNTTSIAIDAFCTKYNLVLKDSELFIPDFPGAAIDVMQKYTETTMEATGKKPLFFVIATSDSFQERYNKRDPILLAQSPFGLYYQILGAWDEEMLNVHEL